MAAKSAKNAHSFIAVGVPDAQHVLTMSDIATHLGTTTTGQVLVRSGIEIERMLSSMVGARATVTARLPSELMFLSHLVSFDPAEQHVTLACCDFKPSNAVVLASKSLVFKCNHRGAQFAFSCTKPRQVTHAGQPSIRMTAPTMMLAMQQGRTAVRTRVPDEADLQCELRMGLISFGARLVDMSLDGRAFLLGDPAIPLCAGTRLQGVRIRLGARESVAVDIEVDRVIQATLPNGESATRIGCRIVAEREPLAKIIRLFIIDMQ